MGVGCVVIRRGRWTNVEMNIDIGRIEVRSDGAIFADDGGYGCEER